MGDDGDSLACWSDCSGHGVCESGRCVCELGWHGQTDLVNYEGYDCPLPRVAELIGWGIASMGAILITVRHVKALRAQLQAFQRLERKAATRGKRLRWYNHVPLRIVVLGLLTLCPWSIVVCACKMAGTTNRRIGVDLVPSIGYLIVGLPGFTANVMHEVRTYEVLVRSAKMGSKADGDPLYTFMTTWYYRALSCYGAGFAVALLLGCFMPDVAPDQAVGPALLILRNVTTILFLIAMAKINHVVATELVKMIELMSSQANKSTENSKVQAVLDFVEHSARAKRKSAISVAVLFVVASLPPLWPFYTFFLIFLYCNVTLTKSHPICSYTGDSKVRGPERASSTTAASFKGTSLAAATSAATTSTAANDE